MHVVIVDGDVSYPATSGKRLRTLNLMLRLAPRHRITYVGRCAPDGDEARLAPEFLRGHGVEPVLVPEPVPRKRGLAFLARLAANQFSSLPYSVASHQSAAMRAALRRMSLERQVDLWQFEWSPYMSLLDADLPGPRLLIAHNVDTLIWERYRDTAAGMARRLFFAGQARKFARFEARAFRQADWVVAVSPEDAALIRQRFGQPKVDVVANGMDRAFYENVQGRRDPYHLLFLGALDWMPNQDAVQLLLDSIFPAVRRQLPQATLHLVGRHPAATLAQRVAQIPGVELHADVPDVRPFLGDCGIMVVPLRIGGGSRLKILEALATGLPVVSTRVGAEGLDLVAGEHYLQAEPDAMPHVLVQAMTHHAPALAQAQKGRDIVLQTYDWSVLADTLEGVWEKCRRQHGAMSQAP